MDSWEYSHAMSRILKIVLGLSNTMGFNFRAPSLCIDSNKEATTEYQPRKLDRFILDQSRKSQAGICQ